MSGQSPIPESLKKSITTVVAECAPSIMLPEVDKMFQSVYNPALDKRFDKERKVLETFAVVKIKELLSDMIDKKIEEAMSKPKCEKSAQVEHDFVNEPAVAEPKQPETKKVRIIGGRKRLEDL